MTLQPGTIIEDKYRIDRMLGKGGMGAVYEGENVRIHRRVAIKILHSEVSDRADVVQRFEREAQAAGRIGSAHIVEVLDLGSLFTGERFMVMEYLDGESLGARIKKRERLTPQELAPTLHALLEGLASAHEAHIIHRDLKPDNIYLVNAKNQPDFVKILDFGVSKFTAAEQGDLAKTSTGMIMGTPYYMSPEQVRAEQLDARSDLYSVGVMMYYAVTGRLPFKAQRFTELAIKITTMPAEPPESIVQLDPQFAAIIHKAMQREKEHRFQTAREFQAAIAQWMMSNSIMPTQQRLQTLPPTSIPPGFLPDAIRASQPSSPPWPGSESRPTPASSSISGGLVIPNQQQVPPSLSNTQFTPTGTSNAGLGISQPGVVATTARPAGNNGTMIALGLFGTLFVAVCGMLVYTFVFDKPQATTPTDAASAVVAAPPPPPTTATQGAPTAMPTALADTVPVASQAPEPAATASSSSQKSSKSTGGGGGKTPPPPPPGTGRKMTGEL
jgi:eukaryotic-like serine/threonine-protein kinase